MDSRRINWAETCAALAVMAIGAFLAFEGSDYPMGSLRRMGAGFMPVAIGVILMLFSVGLLIENMFAEREALPLRLRPILAVSASILFFALTVRSAGMIPSTVGTIMLAAIADAPFRPLRAAFTGVVIGALGYLVFALGLGLSLDPFWW